MKLLHVTKIKPLHVSLCLMCLFCLPISDGYAENESLKASAYYDMGAFAFDEENYPIAIDNFKRALEYQPDNPFYIHFLGKAYMGSGLYQKALETFQHAKQLNPFLHEIENDIALVYFKLKQYNKAGKLFMDIIRKDPINENIEANYFAGLCLFYEKKYKPSITYLTVVSEKDNDLKENCLFHISICLYRLKQIDKAIQSFQHLASTASSQEIRKMSQKWLESIQQQKNYKPYKLLAKISFQYDDNVGLVAPYVKTSNDDDFSLAAYLKGTYRFLRTQDYEIGAGYNHFQTMHQELTDYDITGSTIDLYGKYKYDQTIVGINYQPSYYWISHERFMVCHRFTPQLTWKVTQDYILRMSYTYANKHYYEEISQNGHSHILSFMNIFKIKPYHSNVYLAANAEENHAAGLDKQYKQLQGKLGIRISLPHNTQLMMNSLYQTRRHSRIDMALQKKRKDHLASLGFELSYPLKDNNLWAGIGYYYFHNNSTMDYYDYRKNVISLIWTVKY